TNCRAHALAGATESDWNYYRAGVGRDVADCVDCARNDRIADHTGNRATGSRYQPARRRGLYCFWVSSGRLSLELLRAARLVVDTGMHAKKWTRDQAIDYWKQNTPNSEGESVDAINRYIVMPSQATAYKIGMLKILELREKAKHELGTKFDIRQFHDVVLTNGALPLDVLEDLVNRWIKSKQS